MEKDPITDDTSNDRSKSKQIKIANPKKYTDYLNIGDLDEFILEVEDAINYYLIKQEWYHGFKKNWLAGKKPIEKELKDLRGNLNGLSDDALRILQTATNSDLRAGKTLSQPRNYSTAIDDVKQACETALSKLKSTPKEKNEVKRLFLNRLARIFASHTNEPYTIGEDTLFLFFVKDVFLEMGETKSDNAIFKMVQSYLMPSKFMPSTGNDE
ncbi:MAG: hypothetical protein K9N10_22770 [Deltaproteobacteria bacterium]|nr:hypothetical protein [Deltaproteobacteria bacterium]